MENFSLIQELCTSARVRAPSEYLDFPLVTPPYHTMGFALDGYIKHRLPEPELTAALAAGAAIWVVGIPFDIFRCVSGSLRWLAPAGYCPEPACSTPIPLAYNNWPRAKCNKRPQFLHCPHQRLVVCCVMSGGDYVRHYVGMLRYFVARWRRDPPLSEEMPPGTFPDQAVDALLHVLEFPLMEARLTDWTGFDRIVQPGDVLIYGYADELKQYMLSRATTDRWRLELLDTTDTEWYYSQRFRLTGATTPSPSDASAALSEPLSDSTAARATVLNFYECKEHGWGSISAVSMRRAAELGAREILYISKGATCRSPKDIYQLMICPTRFSVWQRSPAAMIAGRLVSTLHPLLRNGMVEWRPALATGLHVSLPTVIEEDVHFRHFLSLLRATSVDNEAGQIAAALFDLVSAPSWTGTVPIYFTALQFATDYLRRREELHATIEFDLENNRTSAKAERERRHNFDQMFELTMNYLIETVPHRPPPHAQVSLNRTSLLNCIPNDRQPFLPHLPAARALHITEALGCYLNFILPALLRTPKEACLSGLFLARPCADLRLGTDGQPLFESLSVQSEHLGQRRSDTFVLIPRPEVHPPTQPTSFAAMKAQRTFSLIAFWLHPIFAQQWHEKAVAAASATPGTVSPHALTQRIQKPFDSQYYHSLRDLTAADVPMLREFERALEAFLVRTFGVSIGDHPDTHAECYLQYPNALSKATLHVHIAHGFRDPDSLQENNRKISLRDLIQLLSTTPSLLHHRFSSYSISSASNVWKSFMEAKIPYATLSGNYIALGCASDLELDEIATRHRELPATSATIPAKL